LLPPAGFVLIPSLVLAGPIAGAFDALFRAVIQVLPEPDAQTARFVDVERRMTVAS